jgi:hypothetical protein
MIPQTFRNEQTGAEVRLGRSGGSFYVQATHPDYHFPLRKTYEWYERELALRDFDLLCAVVGGAEQARRTA